MLEEYQRENEKAEADAMESSLKEEEFDQYQASPVKQSVKQQKKEKIAFDQQKQEAEFKIEMERMYMEREDKLSL